MSEIENIISETIKQQLSNVETNLDFLYREDELERLEEIRQRKQENE